MIHRFSIAAILLVACCCTVTALAADKPADAKKSSASVAVLTIDGSYPEGAGQAGLFAEMSVNLHDMVARLEKAAKDENVSAVLLEIRGPMMGRGKTNELRTAIAKVKKAGKKIYADVQTVTGADYILACSADKISMPSSGMFMVTGVRAEVTFYKNLLEKLGVKADFLQVGDFKGAAEPMTRDSMSAPFRKQLEFVLDDFYDQMVGTIAADRKLDVKRVKELLDLGILSAEKAKAAGLIDSIVYEDELKADIAKQLGKDEIKLIRDYGKKQLDTDFSGFGGFMKLMEMITGAEPAARASRNPKIAVVYIVGTITTGKGGGGLMGGEVVGSDTIVKALREAADDPSVKGIVLRVDSPGGSGLASDLMWREIVKSKKPIVASMGDVAASGGYYVSMGTKKIFVEPGTLTGSIGVVGGKLAIKGLMDKVGITTEVISRGKNTGWQSMTEPFSPSEKEAFAQMMNEFYQQFVTKAADGRKMDKAKLEALAGGRVYSGKQAVENHLADAVGTLEDAVKEVKTMAGMKSDDKIEIEMLPKPKNLFDALFGGDAMESKFRQSAPAGLLEQARQMETLLKVFAEPNVTIMPYGVQIK